MLEPDFGEVIGQADHGTSSDGASGRGAQVPQREYQSSPHDFQTNEIGFPFPNMFERNLGQMVEQAIQGRSPGFTNRGGLQVPEREDLPSSRTVPEVAAPVRDDDFDIDEIIEQYKMRHPEFAGRGEVSVPERGADLEAKDQIDQSPLGSTERNEIPAPRRQREEAVPSVTSPDFAHRCEVQPVRPVREDSQLDTSFPGLAEAGFDIASDSEEESQSDGTAPESTTRDEAPAHQGDARETRRKNVRKASIQLEFGIERVEDEGYVGGDEEDEARPLRWERSSVKLEFGEERVEDEGYVGDEEDVEDVYE